MIAVNNERLDKEANWQSNFVILLPEIERRLWRAFRQLDAERREDAVAEAIVHSLLSYSRLLDLGNAESATASTLAWYAAMRVKRGRPAAGRMNGDEPLSRYAQIGNGIEVEHRHINWMDLMVEDKRASISDMVAAKLDVGAWFATLSRRMKWIATDLACGCSTSEVAQKYGVSAGRISQLRRKLADSWNAFQHDTLPVLGRC